MNEGDVVLAALPQADGQTKPRPVVILRQMPGFGDWLVCGISSQLQQCVADFDVVIEPGHSDFASSGLKVASVIRLGFIAVLPRNRFLGILGGISADRHRSLLQNLCRFLTPN